MTQTYDIPIRFKEGAYGIGDFEKGTDGAIRLNYEKFGDIVSYNVSDSRYGGVITMYGITQKEIEETLKAVYSDNGDLEHITVNVRNKDLLLYIRFENAQDAKKKIESFAIENADNITEKLCMCKETISRLFIEYFNDGECIDFHAKIGTADQKAALEKKYPGVCSIIDSCGDYPGENIKGDNDRLKIMIRCADSEEMDFFQFAVALMTERIKEKALKSINISNDFKFICAEYD